MWDIVKASRRPRRFARATGDGFSRLSDGVARSLRCPASPRHALLAENPGKPSLWVIINETWYQQLASKPIEGALLAVAPVSSTQTFWAVVSDSSRAAVFLRQTASRMASARE